jgi:glycosyltransferase involved in cell wall biosynthesis
MRHKDSAMKICHVISDLDVGGAERMLVRLLGAMDRGRFEQRVVALIGRGPLSDQVERLGAPLAHLNMRRGAPSFAALLKLRNLIRGFRPDVVQTWLYHADLMGLVAARLAGRSKVVWNIRCSDMDLANYRRTTGVVLKVNAALSGRPAAVISNSRRALELHRELGFRPRREEVIPNGFDVQALRPDSEAGAEVRGELGLPADAPVAGMAARFDPQKGHRYFFDAAGEVARKIPAARFVLAGLGVEPGNRDIEAMIAAAGLETGENVKLLGYREDMHRLMNVFDVLCCPSPYGEGFPSVAGEAMACGVPCVVTDTGDSARVVGESGRVVQPGDSGALARAVIELLSLPEAERAELGRSARKRIVDNFSLPAVAARYESLYESLC